MTDTHEPTDAPVLSTGDDATQWSDEQYLVAFLSQRERQCPLCRYNLRGVTRPRCPECGHSLKLDVRMAEPYLGPWIVAVVMLCLAAGPGVIFILVIAAEGLPPLRYIDLPQFAVLAYILIAVPWAMLTVGLRRGFCRSARGVQWFVALVPAAINGLILLYLLYEIFRW